MKFWNVNSIFIHNPSFFYNNPFHALNVSNYFNNLDYSNFVYPLFSKTLTLAYYDFLITGFIYFSKILPNCFCSDNVLLFTQYYELVQNFDIPSPPIIKLYYPEPFIASPSFVHEDLWFIHILHFQHWLWFFFITLIMFYFIAFINCIDYCAAKNALKKETRGPSRSKCADIVTACIPVSWAVAIISYETVDSTDYYNESFGTGEIVTGVRDPRWGWEYFYPKALDLNYSTGPTYSSLTSSPLKYQNNSPESLDRDSFWRAFQNKTSKNVSKYPNYSLPMSKTSSNVVFNGSELSSIAESSVFKKIKYFTKSDPNLWGSEWPSSPDKFKKLNHNYLNNTRFNDSYAYGTFRQHNYASLNSNLSCFDALLDLKKDSEFFNFVRSLTKKSDYSVTNFFNLKNILPLRSQFNSTSPNSTVPLYKTLFWRPPFNELSDFNGLIFYQNYIETFDAAIAFKNRPYFSKYNLWNRTLMKFRKSYVLMSDQSDQFPYPPLRTDSGINFLEENQKKIFFLRNLRFFFFGPMRSFYSMCHQLLLINRRLGDVTHTHPYLVLQTLQREQSINSYYSFNRVNILPTSPPAPNNNGFFLDNFLRNESYVSVLNRLKGIELKKELDELASIELKKKLNELRALELRFTFIKNKMRESAEVNCAIDRFIRERQVYRKLRDEYEILVTCERRLNLKDTAAESIRRNELAKWPGVLDHFEEAFAAQEARSLYPRVNLQSKDYALYAHLKGYHSNDWYDNLALRAKTRRRGQSLPTIHEEKPRSAQQEVPFLFPRFDGSRRLEDHFKIYSRDIRRPAQPESPSLPKRNNPISFL